MSNKIIQDKIIFLKVRETPDKGKFHKVQLRIQLVKTDYYEDDQKYNVIVSQIKVAFGVDFDISRNNIKDRIQRQILMKSNFIFSEKYNIEPWVRYNLDVNHLDIQKENETIIQLFQNKQFTLRDINKKPVIKIISTKIIDKFIFLTLDFGYYKPSSNLWIIKTALMRGVRSLLQFINMEGATCRMVYKIHWKNKKTDQLHVLNMRDIEFTS